MAFTIALNGQLHAQNNNNNGNNDGKEPSHKDLPLDPDRRVHYKAHPVISTERTEREWRDLPESCQNYLKGMVFQYL
ncbi:MAG: hypothetical protein JJU13_01215 [Balneolaceae bacterium]|nr:hypothetical protein [Balneolaceae bacterium]